MKRPIVVLGAGFGGLTLARDLGRELRGRPEYPVVLVDRGEYHELKPHIPEAAGEWTDCAVRIPIREVLSGTSVRFTRTSVTGLDLAGRQVLTEAGPLPYWRLVWALGAQPDLAPGGVSIPGLAEHALAPYSQGPACRLRHHLARMVQHAAELPAGPARRAHLTVVVAGGGFVGVEMAGMLADRLAWLTRRHGLDHREARLILVEPQSGLLGFDPALGAAAASALQAKGVEIRLGVGLAEAGVGEVRLSDGSREATQSLVWAGGLRGHPLAAAAGLDTDERGLIQVDERLRVPGWPEVYALGDGARAEVLAAQGALVNSGQAAVGQARFTTRALLAEIAGAPVPRYQAHARGVVVSLGHREAVARIGRWVPPRPLAPWFKQVPMLLHLWRLGGRHLLARRWKAFVLPLLLPGRVDRYTLAHDRPAAGSVGCGEKGCARAA